MVRNMWDDEGNNALFDQEGNFTDQEAFETFVEGYRPTWSLHPDEIDDLDNVVNVDFEEIGDSYLGADRYVFDADFEAAVSSIWHFGRVLIPPPVYATDDMNVRASPQDYHQRSGIVFDSSHPETCWCPTCHLLRGFTGDTPRSVDPAATEPDAAPNKPRHQGSAPSVKDKPQRRGWLARVVRQLWKR
ncbi:MAG: hypothetical protein C5B60_01455 [Chloroflexi bacterium]|nr:MAG: hypothetical protein C5B60_01455 [Chloroflexota bacterium]